MHFLTILIKCLPSLCFAYFFTFSCLYSNEEEKPIVVISPSYNNRQWVRKHLDSVFSQNYTNFRLIYVDDASTDGTGELVESYIRNNNLIERAIVIRNESRLGAMANWFTAINLCENEEIVVSLDGDDWLAHSEVLNRINKAYTDSDVWLTYGSHDSEPKGHVNACLTFPKKVIDENGFRDFDWVSSHLRTFYAGLFKLIQVEDLMYGDHFVPTTCDFAIMFPMLEMAGNHMLCIEEVLYIYNRNNPLNDGKINQNLQKAFDIFIRSKHKYTQIEKLF